MEQGLVTARAFAELSRTEAMAFMEPYLEEMVAGFEELRDAAPAEDKATMQFLVDHEAALLRFVQLERSGVHQDSTRDARTLIERARNLHAGRSR